uniref:Transmembrane protein 268 n=1 Tax=Plectus sambesii TaxID=2011161 RepID=A0A914W7G2_9BILA
MSEGAGDRPGPSSPTMMDSGNRSPSSATSETTVIAAPGVRSAETGQWVHFDENEGNDVEPSVSVSRPTTLGMNGLNGNRPEPLGQSAAVGVAQIDVSVHEETKVGPQPTPTAAAQSQQRVVPTAFENGKIVTTILPENDCMPWLVPARFDPYKMPKTLISDQLTMPVEDYVTAMELLTNDYRFRAYTVFYRRLISIWIVMCLVILLILLFSSPSQGGLLVFLLVLAWMLLVAVGLVICLLIKKQINTGLHHCVRSANKILIRHNLLVGVEDRGKLSCHKIAIHFIYFRTSDCMSKIMQMQSQYEQTVGVPTATTSPSVASVSIDMHRPEGLLVERAKILVLKFSQSYVKALAKRTIRFPTRPTEGVSEFSPRHCTKSLCLCQYLQKYHFESPAKKWYEKVF